MNWLKYLPFQTQDNNFSRKNEVENRWLTLELIKRSHQLLDQNEFMTKTLIKYHIINFEYEHNKKLIPELEARKYADETFRRYKELGFIDEWNNVREDLVEYLQ